MASGLVIAGLRKAYPTFTLRVDRLEVPFGRVVAILGENGAGKTTLFRCLLGHVYRDAGRVELDGLPLSLDSVHWRQYLGYVPEESYWYEERTVAWTLHFLSQFYDSWDHELAVRLLRWSRLQPQQKIGELSRGMRRKLQLIAAFACHPRVLLLDEATTGLDIGARREVLDLIQQIVRTRCVAVLFSSHQPRDVEELADQVVFLHRGRIVATGDLQHCLQWQLVHLPNNQVGRKISAQLPGRLAVRHHENGCTALSTAGAQELEEYLGGVKGLDWSREQASLEESFLCLTRD